MIVPPQMIAGGNIANGCFVKLSTAADLTLLQATDGTGSGGDRVFGIAQDGSRDAPIPSASSLAATAGDECRYFGVGEATTLIIGTCGCSRGVLLKSDANGAGITCGAPASTVQWCGAEALESAAAGERCRVVVRNFPIVS